MFANFCLLQMKAIFSVFFVSNISLNYLNDLEFSYKVIADSSSNETYYLFQIIISKHFVLIKQKMNQRKVLLEI